MRGLAGKHWLKETIVLGSGFGFQRLARTQPEPTDPCAGGGGSQALPPLLGSYGLASGPAVGTGTLLSIRI